MNHFRHKFIQALTLLSIFMVALGPLWIGQAEAKLGIEICTAQGVKIIPAPEGFSSETQGPERSSHESMSPCLVCAQSDQDLGLLAHLDFSESFQLVPKESAIGSELYSFKLSFEAVQPISPRAPPHLSLI